MTLVSFLQLAFATGFASALPYCVQLGEGQSQNLTCPDGQNVFKVTFADFGTPSGNCSTGFQVNPQCSTFDASMAHAKQLCLGNPSCSLTANNGAWGPDPCPGVPKILAVAAECDSGPHCYDISFNSTLGSNMVLQQQPSTAAVYGTLIGNSSNVTLTVTWEGGSYTVGATVTQGLWKALLRPTSAGGNYTITATATCESEQATATIYNVTFGDGP